MEEIPKMFRKVSDQQSKCHKIATVYYVVVPKPKCKDISGLTRENSSAERAKKVSLDIIRGLRYLGRQGITLQGHKREDNFTQLILLLGAKNKNIRDHLKKSLEK